MVEFSLIGETNYKLALFNISLCCIHYASLPDRKFYRIVQANQKSTRDYLRANIYMYSDISANCQYSRSHEKMFLHERVTKLWIAGLVIFVFFLYCFSSSPENKNLYTIEYEKSDFLESWNLSSGELAPSNSCGEDEINYESDARNKNILIPMLVWGPNNQLQGFRESVYIAKALNRSIAAPLFFPNWNQKSSLPRTIEASMRLDIQSLTETASVINPAEVADLCGGLVTAIFKTRNNGDNSHFQATLDYYGIKIDDKAEELWFDRRKYPNGKFTDAIDKEKLREYYSTEKKCAILAFPWSSILDEDISKQALLEKNSRDENFKEMIEIIDHTRRPNFVRQAVAKFLKEQKIEEFALMHWRYDMKDFFRAMMPKKLEAKTMIENLKSSQKLKKKFSLEISKIMDEKNLTHFYFASPPDEKKFLKEISSEITDKIFVNDNLLVDFLKKEFQNCSRIMDDFGDLISLAEMELSYLSNLFVFSCFSTWSGNVLLERQINGQLDNKINVELVASALGEKYSGGCFPSTDPR